MWTPVQMSPGESSPDADVAGVVILFCFVHSGLYLVLQVCEASLHFLQHGAQLHVLLQDSLSVRV
jgi:hypothetical protein